MPIIYKKFIFRSDLRANPTWLFLFGDNELRQGYAGQAKQMRGEPNALGICTKRRPSAAPNAYYSDVNLDRNCLQIDKDISKAFVHVARGGTVVVPSDGLGTGMAMLKTKAPKTFEFLQRRLRQLDKFANKKDET